MIDVKNCPVCGNPDLTPKIHAKDFTVTGEIFQIKICKICELLITTPRPSGKELSKYYYSDNYISHTSKAKNLTDHLYLIARKFTLKRKLRLIGQFSRKGKLLDYGSGSGNFLAEAAKKNWDTFGVEPALSVEKNYNKNIVKNIDEVSCAEFNAITLWHVLEHVPELNDALQQLREKLSHIGIIFIAVPNYKSFDAQHYGQHWAGLDVPRHLWHFNERSMIKLLERNLLKLIDIKPMILDSIYVSQLSEKYLNNNTLDFNGFIRGSFYGIKSNVKAMSSKQYSSLIYIARK